MHIILGAIIIAIGIYMVLKTEIFLKTFGSSDFFDKYLGTDGGSRLGYKLLGVLLIFIGLVIMLGMSESLLESILAPLLRHSE